MSQFQPAGWPTVIPRIFTDDVRGLVHFLKTTFGARGEAAENHPSEIWIGDSIVMVSDGGGVRGPHTGFFYVYVQDVDFTYRAAMDAGAASIEPPDDMPWGDRRATVQDSWGNVWQIATSRERST